jgi:hypothetical protein
MLNKLYSLMSALTLLTLAVVAAGCIAWTQDAKGNLQSVGLPGVPVWTASNPPGQQAAAPSPTQMAAAELAPDVAGGSAWLDELNHWRQAAGLQPVAENSQLSEGCRAHANYLLENARAAGVPIVRAGMTMGAAMHRESPGAVGYSDQGAEAARGGRLVRGVTQTADVAFGQRDQAADIDSLLEVPFHRLSLLAPWAETAGDGEAGQAPERAADLALRGRQGRSAGSAIKFPPDGATIPFAAMRAPEWPNPLTSCRDYQLPVGFPVTLQLARPENIAAYSITDLTAGRELASCGFDAQTYDNPDPTQEAYGRRALAAANAIVLIPEHPLETGHRYQVKIQTVAVYQWSFAVGGSVNASAVDKVAAGRGCHIGANTLLADM